MTRWLTDCPEEVRSFFDGVDFPRDLLVPDGSSHPGPLPGLWANPDRVLDSLSSRPFAGAADWVIAIVGHADRSQFEAVTEAVRLGRHLPDRFACLALEGRKFRGQRQRSWVAMRGNMHLTARFAVGLDAMRDQAVLNMIPSMATAEAIHQLSGGRLDPRIKWVNDVWIGNGKVSGALTSTSVTASRITGVTFGIGLNIDAAPDIVPTPFVPRASCLAVSDPALRGQLPGFFEEVVRQLGVALDELARGRREGILERYRARAGFIGKTVRIWPDDTEENWRSVPPICCGVINGLNSDLSLNMAGHPLPIRTGRLAYEENCGLPE